MSGAFSRIAVVNRGEAAMRLLHAVREWRRERGEALTTIAFATSADRDALFVREADEVFDLGPARFTDPSDGRLRSTYLDYGKLEEALVHSRADAAWVGWGFVSEHAAFADLCQRLGVVFIGPAPDVMRRLGDKITSKQMAEEARVPVAPWSGGAVKDVDEARAVAARLGYPLMVKATAGGGGRGIRRVRSEKELATAFESAREEAARSFGDGTLFLERLLGGARHIEVQIVGDTHGTVWALGVRDCTVQRRNQKVLEESPSPALSAQEDLSIREAAARLGRIAGYSGAGTVEFLFDPAERRFSFMEVNARLQVEHPVTEATTGLDLVKLQLHVARGGRLEGEPPAPRGHAIELRINAEDPENDFAPAPGRIDLFRAPTGPGLRLDTGFREGQTIPAEFDSMIAKLIAWGSDREEAMSRLARGLSQSAIVVRGGLTNRSFLLSLLARPEVRSGEVDVGWLDRLSVRGEHVPRAHAEAALVQAAAEAWDAEHEVERARFLSSAARGRPHVRARAGHDVDLRYRGRAARLRVERIGSDALRVTKDGTSVTARVERLGPFERRLFLGEHRHQVLVSTLGPSLVVEVDGVAHRISRDEGGIVRAPAPAVVLSVTAKPGDLVAAGDRLLVLEAMKTELPIVAPFSGRVRQVLVAGGVQVEAGAALAALALEGEPEAESPGADPVDFRRLAAPLPPATPRLRLESLFGRIRSLLQGYDGGADDARGLAAAWARERGAASGEDAGFADACEEAFLRLYADIESLFTRQADPLSDEPGGSQRSAEGHLHAYLRALDAPGRGLPQSFLGALALALQHYGVSGSERTPALEEALLWISRAHARAPVHAQLLLSVLSGRLANPSPVPPAPAQRELFDRLARVAHGSEPALADLARELRHRSFDRPVFEAARDRVYAEALESLAALAADPDTPGRAARIAALVECPQPLVGALAERLPQAPPATQALFLEVLLRRYYRIRVLEDVQSGSSHGRVHLAARYVHEGRRLRLFATHAAWEAAAEALESLASRVAETPASEEVAIDLVLWQTGPEPGAEETATALRAILETVSLPRRVDRLVVIVTGPGRARGIGAVRHVTFRPADGGFREDVFFRGLHPMMAKRLHLWRLSNFESERLPSPEDLYVVRAVARSNPKDERLFAVGEVRDLTPIRDEAGGLVHLPDLERALLEACASIRSYQSKLSARRRLQWNRIFLYVWPVVSDGLGTLTSVLHRLAPAFEDLGLEKVVLAVRVADRGRGEARPLRVEVEGPGTTGMSVAVLPPSTKPLEPVTDVVRKVVAMRQRGMVHPTELVRMLVRAHEGDAPSLPPGEFVEHDLDADGRLVPVSRSPGLNEANVVVGLVRNFTARHPEGMCRVLLLGDPSRDMGALAEPECRRILAALAMANAMDVPVDWFPISSGARIAMDSGTENLDWTARVLRALIERTQAGGEVNVVVAGINVGAQSYWNAEATMLMHTRGILVMTPEASMVLTGKRALDYAGSVSAEDHLGIGGLDRIMGPNGEAQYRAKDVADACRILLRHHELTYVAPGERFPRRGPTGDPSDRDVRAAPHGSVAGDGFATVGEIFDDATNPGRRRPFDIRRVMGAVVDQDQAPLERWAPLLGGETAVVWDARLGGHAVCLVGIESQPLARTGFVPADGPEQWTGGTLFPLSSWKVARALNAASGRRPVVFLANLSGFDGSPESLRERQLEFGAEIGRAVVNFRGPLVFCVVSRYHGGAYVVFSRTLNEGLEVAALEGAHASVIGGAPAAAVVFSAEVEARTAADPRLAALDAEIEAADATERARLRSARAELHRAVHAEKLGEMADAFDAIHSVSRALSVGSLDRILAARALRPYLIDAVLRGMQRSS